MLSEVKLRETNYNNKAKCLIALKMRSIFYDTLHGRKWETYL